MTDLNDAVYVETCSLRGHLCQDTGHFIGGGLEGNSIGDRHELGHFLIQNVAWPEKDHLRSKNNVTS